MKLVSAAKLRRAQDGAQNGRAYVEQLRGVMGQVLLDLPADFKHPLIEQRAEIRRKCVVVIAGERGLCGAFNTNIFKAVALAEFGKNFEVDVVAVGRRAVSAGRRLGWNLVGEFEGLAEDASTWPVEQISERFVSGFVEGRYDEVVVYYTKFVSAMTQQAVREIVLPFGAKSRDEEGDLATVSALGRNVAGQVKYSPSVFELFERLVPVIVRAGLLQAGLESKASEHAARMTAMDSATRNANELIEKLRLYYNRARQSSITKELMDIIGGAEATK